MSRKSTGTVDWRWSPTLQRNCWHGRWTRGDGSRTNWLALDPDIPEHDEEGARKAASSFASTAKATTRDGAGETLSAYSKRWLASRPARTAKDNASHLKHHIEPTIGPVPVIRLTAAHGDELVAYLDKGIAEGSMSDKTARNVWERSVASSAMPLTRSRTRGCGASRRTRSRTSCRRSAQPSGRPSSSSTRRSSLPSSRIRVSRRAGSATWPSRCSLAYETGSNERSAGNTWTLSMAW